MPPAPLQTFSHDGWWWWNGQRWLPAYSADRMWRFDGIRWKRNTRRPPRWLVSSGIVWLCLLGSWLLVGTILLAASAPGDITVAEGIVIASLAALALIATVSWGAFLGRRRATIWLWPAAAVGTAVELFFYVTAMLAAPVVDGAADQDTAAGAGLALLAIPTALLILVLLWLGAGIGCLSRVIKRPPVWGATPS